MSTPVSIPVSEYLASTYRPDCDYVDGELQERNLGEQFHSIVQTTIASIFFVHRKEWRLRPLTEQRVQVLPTRFRVPDVCIVRSDEPIEPILHTPPVLCIEVLSPEDRFSRIQGRVQEYQRMGVAHVWIIDPETRAVWTATGLAGLLPLEGDLLAVPKTDASIPLAEVFEAMDEAPRAKTPSA